MIYELVIGLAGGGRGGEGWVGGFIVMVKDLRWLALSAADGKRRRVQSCEGSKDQMIWMPELRTVLCLPVLASRM